MTTLTQSCGQPGCRGSISDGYCDSCGLAPLPEALSAAGQPSVPAVHVTSGSTRTGSVRQSRRGTSRSSSRSTHTASSRRGHLGAGLVSIPEVPYRDPSTAVLANPQVPERDRFCSKCSKPVGRSREGAPGRADGFCGHCGTGYSFTPKLAPGDLVADQYEVLGCLAHGGLGWVYLARDRNVSDRWVVLKGLLDSGDADAMAAAVAERRFLASVEHPNIVKIFNFVRHPDPRTGAQVGYIVMEYIGGASLKELRSGRDALGALRPLPLAQGLAYMLEILPALGHLHSLGLLYCDFKPDNVIQTQEQLKLIDLGAVRRMDDEISAEYKTDGYCAPELETDGASVESDLFTVARTLAVLTFNFDYRGSYRYTLPAATEVPLLESFPSFRRLLARATAADPDERFGSAAEMSAQLTGVLREVVAAQDGAPRPALSTVFSGERTVFGTDSADWPAVPDPGAIAAALPVPLVDPADPAAGLLATTTLADPRLLLAALDSAADSPEVLLARSRAHIEIGHFAAALEDLTVLEQSDDADWRITWHRGLAALAARDSTAAREHFDLVYYLLPGENAAKLALAVALEAAGDISSAARLYEQVWCTDHGYPSAAFGLARTRLHEDRIDDATAAAESVPAGSSHHLAAQLAAVRAQVHGGARLRAPRYLTAAGRRLDTLPLAPEAKARNSIAVLDAALRLLAEEPRGNYTGQVLGCSFTETTVRRALESQYRALARLADDSTARRDLVNQANAIRPVSWV
ncbi:protein kinase [Nocardia sp. SYP-A9097]|uniref:tetratricopeptide repeat protein n=1 Tax=Nocardia sp. SYP-A9097 TaxID=2663237 RepID=UPI00129A6691|nr:tetratricopeptide repeat protein [Nocardia sp. SYP-A9097]MRH93085.1 protein kinase [Nocardia sp. SYP-A9097]